MTPRRRIERRPRLLVFAPAVGPSVAATVFEGTGAGAGARLALGLAAAVLVYGALAVWAVGRPFRRPVATASAPEVVVELFEIPVPVDLPPNPVIAAPRVSSRSVPALSRTPTLAAAEQPPAPAQAAEVVAREPMADEAVDLTAFSIATGNAARYAGGDTSSTGSNPRAVTGAVVGGHGPGAASAAALVDLSRPVGISDTEWRDCSWPQEADALGIDQQVVSMRAISRADGTFESADVVDDPGHGFGAALLSCARRHGFIPALDRQGHQVRARSGTIRFTFTR